MEVTAKELRLSPGRIIEKSAPGTEMYIPYRDRRMTKIVPLDRTESAGVSVVDEIFGLWKDREHEDTVDATVRRIRKGR